MTREQLKQEIITCWSQFPVPTPYEFFDGPWRYALDEETLAPEELDYRDMLCGKRFDEVDFKELLRIPADLIGWIGKGKTGSYYTASQLLATLAYLGTDLEFAALNEADRLAGWLWVFVETGKLQQRYTSEQIAVLHEFYEHIWSDQSLRWQHYQAVSELKEFYDAELFR